MQNLRYHIVQPSNKRDTYTDFDNVDFLISAAGRKLVMGSVRLLGDVTVYPKTSGGQLIDPTTETISFDGLTGSHSWFSQIITSGSNVGQIENLNFYPHYIASMARAQLTREDTFNSQYTCENVCADGIISSALLKGTTSALQGNPFDAALTSEMNMAPRLKFCLNNPTAGSDPNMAFAVVGDLSVSLIISQSISVLYGTEKAGEEKIIGVDRNITISNLRLSFASVPDDGVYPKLGYQMRVATSLKQSLQSTYANISTLVPLVSDRFWFVFVPQDRDNNPLYNGLACYRPPNVQRVEYLWSDSFNAEYTYAIDNSEELLTNFVKAVNGISADNMASLNVLASNDGYGLGIPFGSFIDLRKNKISVNITSDISNTSPFICYMFFSGIVNV